MKTVTAVFDTRAAAVRGVEALVASGHRRETVSIVMGRPLEGGSVPAARRLADRPDRLPLPFDADVTLQAANPIDGSLPPAGPASSPRSQ